MYRGEVVPGVKLGAKYTGVKLSGSGVKFRITVYIDFPNTMHSWYNTK